MPEMSEKREGVSAKRRETCHPLWENNTYQTMFLIKLKELKMQP